MRFTRLIVALLLVNLLRKVNAAKLQVNVALPRLIAT